MSDRGSESPLPRLPARRPDSHKGDYGRALLVGGSRGMSGAIALAGTAALRSGAGLVTLAVPDVCLETVASFEPSYMTVPMSNDRRGRLKFGDESAWLALIEPATCVGLGPGLGQSDGIEELVTWFYTRLSSPLVLDADGLNALAARGAALSGAAGPRILTPHPGEFRRLAAAEGLAAESLADGAVDMARRHGVVVVLKGHRSVITDGQRVVRNPTGNAGMATGGSGDVLTGIITALVCQGLPAFEAAHLAAYVHGLAGDLAAAELGQVSLIARDLVEFLPRAFQQASGAAPA